MKINYVKLRYSNACKTCTHTDIMYCHNCIHYYLMPIQSGKRK